MATMAEEKDERFLWRGDPKETFSDWTLEIISEKTTTDTSGDTIPPAAKRARSTLTNSPAEGNSEKVTHKYHVHRGVLSYGPRKSEYFAKQFRHAQDGYCIESKLQTTQIHFDPIVAAGIPDLLDYLYSPEVDVKEIDDIKKLVTLHFLGNYFAISTLVEECLSAVSDRMNLSNANDICLHAEALFSSDVKNLVADFVCKNLCSMDINNLIVQCHGYEFWEEVTSSKFWPAELSKSYSEHWSRIFYELSKFHRNALTFETFEALTSPSKLPFISVDVAGPLIVLDFELNSTGASQGESSLHTRCSNSLVQSWRELPSLNNLSQVLSSVPQKSNLVVQILLDCVGKANCELRTSEQRNEQILDISQAEAKQLKEGMCNGCRIKYHATAMARRRTLMRRIG